MCRMDSGGGFRGPPIPLVVVPVVYHLVQSNPDLKLTKYVKDLLCKGGPVSVAENAHYIVQCKQCLPSYRTSTQQFLFRVR
jgi:hypothetical protein